MVSQSITYYKNMTWSSNNHGHSVHTDYNDSLLQMAYYNCLEEGNKTLSYARQNKRNLRFKFSFGPLQNFGPSLREGNFRLCIESIQNITPCIFIFNHTNYARQLNGQSPHLESTHLEIHGKFLQGSFLAWKTVKSFSVISISYRT